MWYGTGTASVTNNNAVVNIAGAALVANVAEGYALIVYGSGVLPVEILAINSDTQLTLARPWPGSTGAGLSYAIMPNDGPVVSLFQRVSQLLDSMAAVRDGAGQGMFGGGTLAAPGIRFAVDQNSGLRLKGSDQLAITAGGQDRVVFAFNAATVLYAEANGSVAADMAGRSVDGAGYLRFTNDIQAILYGYLGHNGALDMVLVSEQGNLHQRAAAGKAIYFAVGGTAQAQLITGSLSPVSDNAVTLGGPSTRWGTVYSGTGTISTSDGRLKTWRGSLSDAEVAAALAIEASIGVFQFNDAIEEKGASAARWHTGVVAQEVIATMEAHGLDPMRYAFVCYDEWEEDPAVSDEAGAVLVDARPAGNIYGIRETQLAMFIAAAQRQSRLSLEERVAALEAA